ncbi:MAG: carotenoid oxygenase family protein, partial [Halobacteriales archaeon]
MPADYATGFQGVEEELTDELLAVEGTIPEWLDGSLVRNGPGTFEAGGETVDHWFDGLAMLRKFTFDAGTVRYSNRYLRTDAYEQAQRGEFDGGFATGESTLRGRIKSFLFADTYDNTNIIAERLGNRYFALTETPRWIEFDPETLETIGDFEYTG